MHIRWLGPTNERITQGKIYEVDIRNNCIKDDKGCPMEPWIRNDESYWRIVKNKSVSPIKYIKRIGRSNTRVTQGKIYEMDTHNNCIKDDKGRSMEPCVKKKGCWEILENEPKASYAPNPNHSIQEMRGIMEGTFAFLEPYGEAATSIKRCTTTGNVNFKQYQRQSLAGAEVWGNLEKPFTPKPLSSEEIKECIEKFHEHWSYTFKKLYYLNLGESKMNEVQKTVVETVTLINDRRAEGFSIDEILNLIEKEEKKLARLEEVKANSKAIDKLKMQHKETIAALITVLDGRE